MTTTINLVEVSDGKRSTDLIQAATPRTTYDEMKLIPGSRYDSQHDTWVLPLTMASCHIMRHIFGEDLVIGEELAQWSKKEVATRINPVMELQHAKDTEFTDYEDEQFHLKDFQRVGAKILTLSKAHLLGDDMRVGKTPQLIRALRHLHGSGAEVLPALIVCPPLVKSVWRNHLEDFWPESGLNIQIPKAGLAATEKAVKAEPDILVVHYEMLALMSNLQGWGSEKLKLCKECQPEVYKEGEFVPNNLQVSKCEVHSKPLNSIVWKTLILDETHRIGEASALMTRAAKRLREQADYVWAASGTPPEDPDRLWSIMNFVNPQEYPSKSRFREMFVNTKVNPWSGFPEPNLDKPWKDDTRELFDKIWRPRFTRRPKGAVHDVVEPEVITLEPEMTPKQAKAYKDLRKHLFTELDSGVYWADGPGAAISRLRQLASAYADVEFEELEDGTVRQIIHLQEPSSKLDAFGEYWESIGKDSVVVFAEQAQLIELAHLRYPDESVKLVGGMSDSARDKAVATFQAGDVPIIFSTTATGGEGISLNRADTLCYIQLPNARFIKRQCDERIYTEGRPSFIVNFITPNTVDERVPKTLALKNARFEDLVQDKEILREWLKD